MADVNYSGVQRGDDTRYKINNNILRMMNTNPTLGIGYLIGNALGENYWGRKRAKSAQQAHDATLNGSIGADEKKGAYGVDTNKKGNDYYTSINNALKEYQNNGGKVLYEGRSPKTPQQANSSGITVGNAGNGGGVTSVADYWNKMSNGSGYNPGNTTLYTNGTRDMGNVMPGSIGADANGVYGVRPAAPTPYTDDQLRQIATQNFTPEELSKMATADERARMNALMAPPTQAAPAQGGGAPSPEAVPQAAPAPTAEAAPDPSEAYPMATESGSGESGLTPGQIGILNQIAAAAAAEEEAAQNAVAQNQSGGTNWRQVFANPYQVEGPGTQIGFRYVADPNNPSFLDKLLAKS